MRPLSCIGWIEEFNRLIAIINAVNIYLSMNLSHVVPAIDEIELRKARLVQLEFLRVVVEQREPLPEEIEELRSWFKEQTEKG